mmetsp:Transcript_24614/g.76634  ORF Transcript_24614/g.76634 Transcript_24614/m.76634 type:complete len:233 (-) Transcript_24614:47-745(-)
MQTVPLSLRSPGELQTSLKYSAMWALSASITTKSKGFMLPASTSFTKAGNVSVAMPMRCEILPLAALAANCCAPNSIKKASNSRDTTSPSAGRPSAMESVATPQKAPTSSTRLAPEIEQRSRRSSQRSSVADQAASARMLVLPSVKRASQSALATFSRKALTGSLACEAAQPTPTAGPLRWLFGKVDMGCAPLAMPPGGFSGPCWVLVPAVRWSLGNADVAMLLLVVQPLER